MLVLEWKERAVIEKVNSRCFSWFPAVILVDQKDPPIWRLHTKLYKGAWNVLANNSKTVGHKDLRLGKIVYILVFYNISFSWLLPLDGFQFIFSLRDSENDLLVWDTNMADVSLFWDTNGRRDVVWNHCITHKLLTTLYLWYCLWRWPCSPAKCPEVDYQNANTVLSAKDLKKHMFVFHCHAFMSIKRKKKKPGSGGTRSVLPRFSPIPSFTYSNYSVDYPSICPGQRRAFRES